jgi:hypothetical protein
MFARLLLCAFGIGASAGPAAALDVSAFYESCFIRNYDAAHLDKHPGQRVAAMQVEIIEWEASPFVRIDYAVRGGANYRLAGDCYDEITGGFLCHLCADDSCQTGEETFKVMLKNTDAITIVNDTTGVTGENDGGERDHLDPGGEHGAFALTRTAYSVCEN